MCSTLYNVRTSPLAAVTDSDSAWVSVAMIDERRQLVRNVQQDGLRRARNGRKRFECVSRQGHDVRFCSTIATVSVQTSRATHVSLANTAGDRVDKEERPWLHTTRCQSVAQLAAEYFTRDSFCNSAQQITDLKNYSVSTKSEAPKHFEMTMWQPFVQETHQEMR